ncbi:MAG: aldolase/citrate lyase family protein [Clostridia bacterium]|nr:aldolase/citrate lyase family protein [Clostridia bacterium]
MTIKEKVEKALPMVGAHSHLTDSIVTEIFANLDYDYVWIDMEHTMLSCEQVYHHILAAHTGGCAAIVRVPVTDLTYTKRIVEMGVDGIVFPMVKNAEHAKELLDMTLYPPIGKRGCGPKGAVRYGIDSEPDFYVNGHKRLCRFVQIELESAANDAEAIAKLPYLDGCVLGMHDLSGSIGRLGDIFCEENMALANRAIAAFKAEGKTVGVSTCATDEETLRRYNDMGINMITTGADFDYILKGGIKTLETMKKVRG